jgi:hypothetical protein
METVLILVSADTPEAVWRFFEQYWQSEQVQPLLLTPADLPTAPTQIAAIVLYGWGCDASELATRCQALRAKYGHRKRMLAILPRPPHTYPEDLQAQWQVATGYGNSIHALQQIIGDFLAGRR